MDGTRRFRSYVTRYSVRPGKLAEQPFDSIAILFNIRVGLRVRSLQVSVCNDPWPAMSWTNDVHHVEVVHPNEAVQMRINEVQTRRSPPMPQKPRFNIFFN